MVNLVEYMPIILIALVTLFFVLFFTYVFRGISKNRKFDTGSVSIARLPKRFEVLENGRQVVAIPGSLYGVYGDARKSEAITQAMAPGTTIGDAEGNRYVVEEFLKWPSQNRHIFDGAAQYYLVFSVHASSEKGVETGAEFSFDEFKKENAERKAAVKAGRLSEAEYKEWQKQQHELVEQLDF